MYVSGMNSMAVVNNSYGERVLQFGKTQKGPKQCCFEVAIDQSLAWGNCAIVIHILGRRTTIVAISVLFCSVFPLRLSPKTTKPKSTAESKKESDTWLCLSFNSAYYNTCVCSGSMFFFHSIWSATVLC